MLAMFTKLRPKYMCLSIFFLICRLLDMSYRRLPRSYFGNFLWPPAWPRCSQRGNGQGYHAYLALYMLTHVGNSWAFLGALYFFSIMEFLPLPKYAYSLKPICGAKLVTAYLVWKVETRFGMKSSRYASIISEKSSFFWATTKRVLFPENLANCPSAHL